MKHPDIKYLSFFSLPTRNGNVDIRAHVLHQAIGDSTGGRKKVWEEEKKKRKKEFLIRLITTKNPKSIDQSSLADSLPPFPPPCFSPSVFAKMFVIGFPIDRSPARKYVRQFSPANIAIHFAGVLETDIVDAWKPIKIIT